MRIRTQSRYRITNSREFVIIKSKSNNPNRIWNYNIYALGDDLQYNIHSVLIGTFTTEEKALKVMDEIQKLLDYCYNETYQVPKDDLVIL